MGFCVIHVMVLEKAGVSVTLGSEAPVILDCPPPPRPVVVFGPGVLCGLQVLIAPFLIPTTGQSLLEKLSSYCMPTTVHSWVHTGPSHGHSPTTGQRRARPCEKASLDEKSL